PTPEFLVSCVAGCSQGHIGLFQWLLRQGRNDVNDTCPNGMSPLFIAADYSSAEMVEAVIK
ncbi:unnamed protein product, partial [Ectocarpus sp. 12 AP-2014]